MSDDIQTALQQLQTMTPELQAGILKYAQDNNLTPDQLAGHIQQQASLNQTSVNSEASLVMGGYDAGVATAVAGSAGQGVSEEQAQQAAADFARQAAEAIRNGIPIDQMRFDDPTLTDAAKAAIYEQAAAAQGTSTQKIEEEARKRAEADIAAAQSMMGGLVGFGMATTVASQGSEYGITSAPMAFADLGPTTAAIAAMGPGGFSPPNLPGQQRERDGFGMMA